MHNKSYNINVACFCSENFIKSLDELKSFFSFNYESVSSDFKNSTNLKYDAIIVESHLEKKISLNKLNIPKIFIQNEINKRIKQDSFELNFKLPINIFDFNQGVIDLCKKYEFNKNSLIKIKDYILDKNERVLKKSNTILKVTEKEINFIVALHLSQKSLSKNYILKNIWSYSSDADTHTVETHIYRLRQKIKETFDDNNFIKNSVDGYSL
tara:strand:+ start:219 stop:851 length:633 start_codon:yes stop_codon:yes gene_type:complete